MPKLEYRRGWVYEIRIRFESNPEHLHVKMGVCLQNDEWSQSWGFANFARTHSYKDAEELKKRRVYSWDIYVPPKDSRSEFGIKVICSEIWHVEEKHIIQMVYQLPNNIVDIMNRKLLFALGMQLGISS